LFCKTTHTNVTHQICILLRLTTVKIIKHIQTKRTQTEKKVDKPLCRIWLMITSITMNVPVRPIPALHRRHHTEHCADFSRVLSFSLSRSPQKNLASCPTANPVQNLTLLPPVRALTRGSHKRATVVFLFLISNKSLCM